MRRKGCIPGNAVQAVINPSRAGLGCARVWPPLSCAESRFPGRPMVLLVGSAAPQQVSSLLRHSVLQETPDNSTER